MKLIKHQPNVHSVKVQLKSSNETFKLGLFSDVHFDSDKCHRSMFKRHLEQCDGINIFGDLFDVMGAYKDPRSKPADIRQP